MEKVVIIDGNLLLHRACQSIKADKLGNKESTAYALSLFLKAMQRVLREYSPRRCFVIWDGGKSERRLTLHPEYKANRKIKEPTEEQRSYFAFFNDQKEVLFKLLPKLCVYSILLQYREADDVIWLFCKLAMQNQYKPIIVSDDSDFLQLVHQGVDIYLPRKDVIVDINNFHSEIGVKPHRYLTYKALLGDSTDSIPGIAGVGKVTVGTIINDSPSIVHDELKEWCNKHTNPKIRSVAENFDTFLRNLEMIDLKREEFTHKEITKCYHCLTNDIHSDVDSIVEDFLHVGVRDIIRDYYAWSIPFRRLCVIEEDN